jgi:hypothetical protein
VFSWKRARKALLVIVIVLVAAYATLWFVPDAKSEPAWGVQFSKSHAQWLGLDWRATYTALLDDVGVRRFRLGAYWPEIEPTPGDLTFTDLDWMMDQAAARGATVVLVVGRRLPRWPECHAPDWARTESESQQQDRIRTIFHAVIERYRSHPALAVWQVENEPFLTLFGECPPTDPAVFAREVELTRELDPNHPILITDSGELSLWMRTAAAGDLLGTTMYRVVWNRLVGYWSYDILIPPAFYRLKAWLAGKPSDSMVIAELQAEPWIPKGDIFTTPLEEQRKSMDAVRFQKHVAFARATGFREAYLWGAEYWYWLKEKHDDATLWDEAKRLLAARSQ